LIKYSQSAVIDYVWQYSRYYGNQLVFLRDIESNGSASLFYLFNMLENMLKAHVNKFDPNFQTIVKFAYEDGLLTKVEHDFLNNKKTGVRKLRNIFAHANLSKFNIQFKGDPTLYPLTENDNCQHLYEKLSGIIFNIMLKVALVVLNVNVQVDIDDLIKALKFNIVIFTPEEILLDKGIDLNNLDEWDNLNESHKYRLAENAQNVKVLAHIFTNIKNQLD